MCDTMNGGAGKKKKQLARDLKDRQKREVQAMTKYDRGRENHVLNKWDQNKSSLEYQSFSEKGNRTLGQSQVV